MKNTIAFLFLLCTFSLTAQQKMQDKPRNILPELKESVNDLEKLLTEAQRAELTTDVQGESKAKIIVFTSPDAGFYETFADYLADVCIKNHFDAPGNDYVLIAVSQNLMEIRILCSKSLEGKLPEATLQSLINNQMIPEFREALLFEGIQKTVFSIQKLL